MTPERALHKVRVASIDLQNYQARRLKLARALAEAREAGVQQETLAKETGYGREQVRRLVQAARTVDYLPDGYTDHQIQEAFSILSSSKSGPRAVATAAHLTDIPERYLTAAYRWAQADAERLKRGAR